VNAPPAAHDRLRAALEEISREFPGILGIALEDLTTGATLAVHGDTRFPAASLIKLAVMIEVFHRVAAGTLRRDATVTLRDGDRAGDDPAPLALLHDGAILTIADLVALMIAFSDDTATNLLLHLVTVAAVNERMASCGLHDTRIFRPTFRDGHAEADPELERELGLGMTTPREAARLLALLAEGRILGRGWCDEMLALLRRQHDRAMIARPLLGETILIANKTGWDREKLSDAMGRRGEVRTDVAYVEAPPLRYVLAVCARQVRDSDPGADNVALRTGARVSRLVYDALRAPSS
jgi:beta-lactamase class A